jgi:hypothetical protein
LIQNRSVSHHHRQGSREQRETGSSSSSRYPFFERYQIRWWSLREAGHDWLVSLSISQQAHIGKLEARFFIIADKICSDVFVPAKRASGPRIFLQSQHKQQKVQ